MRLISYGIIGVMLGIIGTQSAYSKMFDPLQYWDTATHLAERAHYLGCMTQIKDSVKCSAESKKFLAFISRI